jgi:hypothetical protein
MEIEKQDARAGKTGMGVRYVLFISLALVVILFAALYFGFLKGF